MAKRILVLFILTSALTTGCGYSVIHTSSLPVKSLSINQVKNHTSEPGLQDLFVRTFTEECRKHGIDTSGRQGTGLSVWLTGYKLSTISIKHDLSAEYLISISADIRITYPDGTVKEMKALSPEFMETFSAPEDIQALQAGRDLANERAMREISQRIISELIYRGSE